MGKLLSVYLKNFLACLISLEKDKNDFEKTIKPGRSSIFFSKYIFILFISLSDKLEHLYNILSLDNFKDFDLTPS